MHPLHWWSYRYTHWWLIYICVWLKYGEQCKVVILKYFNQNFQYSNWSLGTITKFPPGRCPVLNFSATRSRQFWNEVRINIFWGKHYNDLNSYSVHRITEYLEKSPLLGAFRAVLKISIIFSNFPLMVIAFRPYL